ncbi:hypothetical protein [Methylobacterium nigriterrae]|uniref:hypothetical protein n=1 Tax=Methylobacterium nigriterrae TaxID=3127512 RepID=UPI0030136229
MERETARFKTLGSDGVTYTIIELQTVKQLSAFSGHRTAKGPQRYVTEEGRAVRKLGDGSFQIAETSLILKKV